MDIRRLAINNSQKVVGAFKEIVLDTPTGAEASNNAVSDFPGPKASNNIVSDLPKPEAFNNAVSDLPGLDSSSATPKRLYNTNTRLSNNQKKKATQ